MFRIKSAFLFEYVIHIWPQYFSQIKSSLDMFRLLSNGTYGTSSRGRKVINLHVSVEVTLVCPEIWQCNFGASSLQRHFAERQNDLRNQARRQFHTSPHTARKTEQVNLLLAAKSV